MEDMRSYSQDDPRWAKSQALANKLATINLRLKKTTDKNNIMRESKELFYDESFLEEQDNNPYLLGFANGIYDLKKDLSELVVQKIMLLRVLTLIMYLMKKLIKRLLMKSISLWNNCSLLRNCVIICGNI